MSLSEVYLYPVPEKYRAFWLLLLFVHRGTYLKLNKAI